MNPELWPDAELEAVACNRCGRHDDVPVIVRPDGLSVVACRQCRLQYLNPRPPAAAIARLYDHDYYRQDGAAPIGYADYLAAPQRRALALKGVKRLNLVERHCRLAGKRLLEIGCASGELGAEAAARGVRYVGVDIAADGIAVARQRHPGLDFRIGTIETLTGLGQFDVVCSYEAIEHVLDPLTFLRTIREHLAPLGWLVLTTANAAQALRTGPERWAGYLTSFEHLYFFDPATLGDLAEAAGFTTIAHYSRGSGDIAAFGHRPHRVQALKSRINAWPGIAGLRRFLVRWSGAHGMAPAGDAHELVIILRAQAG